MNDICEQIKPLEDRVLIQGISEIDTSVSGIIIPETASKDRPQRGKILAAGPGKKTDDGKRIPMDVKVGDIVIFSKYAPDEITIDGEDFIIAREDSIIAIVNK